MKYIPSLQFSRSAFGFGNLVPFESSLRWGALFWICGPRLLNVATGGVWDLFVLLPKILGCWGFFARAFLLGRLVNLLREKCWCWCGLRHCWRVVVAVSPWVFPGFARLGKLSQTSDRLNSCGFPDRQSRPSSATGAGGF